jgi:hypothetical protein
MGRHPEPFTPADIRLKLADQPDTERSIPIADLGHLAIDDAEISADHVRLLM